MRTTDPWAALAAATRQHASVRADRTATVPGSADHRRADHRLDLVRDQLRYWESRARTTTLTDPLGDRPD